MDWLQSIAGLVERHGAAARVVIVETDGPTPRAAGAAMLVWETGTVGKIGRGEIERRSVEVARDLIGRAGVALASDKPLWLRESLRFSTGDVLGERSGGSIEVLIEAYGDPEIAALADQRRELSQANAIARPAAGGVQAELVQIEQHRNTGKWGEPLAGLASDRSRPITRLSSQETGPLIVERLVRVAPPFYVYGTGLVARALVRILAGLPFEVTWLDTAPGKFPGGATVGVIALASADFVSHARLAPPGGFHAVMTASHDLDLAVCRAIIENGRAAYLGVIGSRLKRERMFERLKQEGCSEADLSRICCPIGLPQIKSKLPEVIAVGIAAQALTFLPTASVVREER